MAKLGNSGGWRAIRRAVFVGDVLILSGMWGFKGLAAVLVCVVLAGETRGQRTYVSQSVLATGDWYQLGVSASGLHRIDAGVFSRLGITLPVASASIRLFGNGGAMLPEANLSTRVDDLRENAIWVEDGGDGSFGGSDYILFYSEGPERWEPDSANRAFRFVRNLYSGEAFYYLNIASNGRRVGVQPAVGAPTFGTDRFEARHAQEPDSLNFLASGKGWYGDEFGTGPGRLLSREYVLPGGAAVAGTPVTVRSEVIARSNGVPAAFEVRLNGALAHRLTPPALAGILYEPVATPASASTTLSAPAQPLRVGLAFSPGSVNSQGWLDRFEVFWTRPLDMAGAVQLPFRAWAGVAPGAVGEYVIRNAPAGTRVWEVTDPLAPVAMTLTAGGTELRFRNDASRLREYVAFSGGAFPVARAVGRVPNQDLHRPLPAQMVIVATPQTLEQARRLADHHRTRDGITSVVADVRQVFHEFSSGIPDPGAVRDYVRMFFDRAGADTSRRPRYLLLFGDATYDYRNRLRGDPLPTVPAWQSQNALDPLVTHVSDDFFGLLETGEDINAVVFPGTLDIGIGRIPAATAAEARTMVDKVVRYHQPAALGPWRNRITFVADDEDQNLHLDDAEYHAAMVGRTAPLFNIGKAYLDAFRQESGAGGSRYPAVRAAIDSRIFSGTLIWNYSGHGGSRRLAEEAVLDEDMVTSWRNDDRLPLFITATCDFAPYDNPIETSIGEKILLARPSGGIALMTTTRLVFAYSNRVMNHNYLLTALQPGADGRYPSLGDAVRRAKELTTQTSGDVVNNRKFTLLGDPALTLGFPILELRTTTVNGQPVAQFRDTLRALDRHTLGGEVVDAAGRPQSAFNGTAHLAVYDKEQRLTTLANDPGSRPVGFNARPNPVFNGKARVVNGRFTFSFVLPRDIDYAPGPGRISLYAENGSAEAAGADALYIGGLGNSLRDDGDGPSIRAWLNDERFVNGGVTDETPLLIVRLTDSTGINAAGTGIGHDITAVIDDNTRETLVLNDFYTADTDSDRSGSVRYRLPRLEEGPHRIRIRAWDVFNNSREYTLECRVVKRQDLALDRVLNHPNPFTTRTRFWFEHNRPGEELLVTVQVMTVTGRVVRTLTQRIVSEGVRSDDIEWDGRDDQGAPLGRGVYLYRLRVRTADGRHAEKLEKLVIL